MTRPKIRTCSIVSGARDPGCGFKADQFKVCEEMTTLRRFKMGEGLRRFVAFADLLLRCLSAQ